MGIVVLAVMALVAVGTLIIENWKSIKEFATKIWNDIANFFVGIWDDIKGIFTKYWADILAVLFPAVGIPILIAQHWQQIVDFFEGLWSDVTGIFRDWGSNITGFFSSLWNDVINIFQTFWTREVNGWKNIWNDVTGIFTTWKDDFIKGIANIWNDISGAFGKLYDGIKGFFTGLWADVEGIWDTAINWIISKVDDLIKLIDKVPGIHISAIPELGTSATTPSIPGQALGGITTMPGLSWVGENGPELLNLPVGATVTPLSATSDRSGPLYANVIIDGYTFARVVSEYQDRDYRGAGNI